jgi:hypothetical protein
MHTGSLLCLESIDGLEPLGAFNQPVYRSYGQIRAALLNDLGKPFADYFARPDFDADSARVGWVAHDTGKPRRWLDLSPEEQSRLDPVRQRFLGKFAEYRRQLEAAPENSPRSNFAKLLVQAAHVPGPQYLYFIGEQPVVAFWGFKTAGTPSGVDPLRLIPGSVVLGRDRPVSPALDLNPVPIPTTARMPWWRWLLWLVALLLLLAMLFGLWAWWTGRPLDPRAWVDLPSATTSLVPRNTASFHHDLGERQITPPLVDRSAGRDGTAGRGETTLRGESPTTCVGAGCEPSTLQRVEQPKDRGLDQTSVPRASPSLQPDAVKPSTRDQASTPTGLPALPPAGPPGERGKPLAIPDDARPGPADFMQGVWRSRSGLVLNGKPAEEFYRFGKDGQGDVTLRTRDGSTQCSGPAQAVVGPDKQLSFHEAPQLACSDGNTVSGATTECHAAPGHAVCEGTNQSNGSRFSVQVEGTERK